MNFLNNENLLFLTLNENSRRIFIISNQFVEKENPKSIGVTSMYGFVSCEVCVCDKGRHA